MRAPLPHPFERFSARARRGALLAFVGISIAMMLVLSSLDARLRTPASPHGILSFEFAGDDERAMRMLEAWGSEGRARAALSLKLDFIFLAAYAPALALLCAGVADRRRSLGAGLANGGAALAWAQLAAGGLDAIENLALLRVLGPTPTGGSAGAAACASAKFALVAAGLLYVVSSIACRRFRRANPA